MGSAGSVLRSQGSLREGELSRCARGVGLIASSACSGPIPLPLRLGGVKGLRCGVGPAYVSYAGPTLKSPEVSDPEVSAWRGRLRGRSRICVIYGTDPATTPRSTSLSRYRVNLARSWEG